MWEDLYKNKAEWPEDMSEALRVEWCLAMLDFPPDAPSVGAMIRLASRTRRGESSRFDPWTAHAVAFHRLGYSPIDWYLLRMCAEPRLDELLARGDGRFLVDAGGLGSYALVPDDCRDWLLFVRNGLTPLRAFDLVVDGDRRSWPSGGWADEDGIIDHPV